MNIFDGKISRWQLFSFHSIANWFTVARAHAAWSDNFEWMIFNGCCLIALLCSECRLLSSKVTSIVTFISCTICWVIWFISRCWFTIFLASCQRLLHNNVAHNKRKKIKKHWLSCGFPIFHFHSSFIRDFPCKCNTIETSDFFINTKHITYAVRCDYVNGWEWEEKSSSLKKEDQLVPACASTENGCKKNIIKNILNGIYWNKKHAQFLKFLELRHRWKKETNNVVKSN